MTITKSDEQHTKDKIFLQKRILELSFNLHAKEQQINRLKAENEKLQQKLSAFDLLTDNSYNYFSLLHQMAK